ncbi:MULTISPECIES: hypothetical protein [Pumilibacter]|uniref:hypothetical protein n=1 Tax=Pumilibacter TaxID=2941493 RepID=UPI00203E0EB0|nr:MULTISPECIES: hypothetical protein [Pumilibacter]
MNEKLLIIGECTAEIKKLLLQLFTAETESIQCFPTDNDSFICVAEGQAETQEQLKSLGYKTVTIAYTNDLINKIIGNSDLEKHGYKFEDGV